MIMNVSKKKFACVILAAGKSERFEKNKLFTLLNKTPLLFIVINSILSFNIIERMVVVASNSDFDRIKKRYINDKRVSVVLGGKNRTESTTQGLRAVDQENYEYTYIHDGARPIFSKNDFLKLKKEILTKNLDGVVQYVNVCDSIIGFEKNTKNHRYLDRKKMIQLKTPHLYRTKSIFESLINYKMCDKERENAEILFLYGKKIGFVEGSIDNIKVTYEDDIRIIKKLL